MSRKSPRSRLGSLRQAYLKNLWVTRSDTRPSVGKSSHGAIPKCRYRKLYGRPTEKMTKYITGDKPTEVSRVNRVIQHARGDVRQHKTGMAAGWLRLYLVPEVRRHHPASRAHPVERLHLGVFWRLVISDGAASGR